MQNIGFNSYITCIRSTRIVSTVIPSKHAIQSGSSRCGVDVHGRRERGEVVIPSAVVDVVVQGSSTTQSYMVGDELDEPTIFEGGR